MKKFNSGKFSFIMLLAFIAIMALMFTGCRTKKTVVDKKETTVSEITKNNIKTSEAAKIETSVFTITDSQKWSIVPMDQEKQVIVIKGKDTLKFTGATVNFDNSHSSTSTNVLEQSSKDHTDSGTRSSSQKTTEKKKAQEVKSTSWGGNLATILGVLFLIIAVACGVYLHFNTPRNPLS